MNRKRYPIQLEISGPTAIWTNPDSGPTPTSYPAPTFSSVKGIFEAVAFWKDVAVVPTKVEICRPVVFHRYTTNYGGPLRAASSIASGAAYQLFAQVLINVCYRMYADVVWCDDKQGNKPVNAPHAFQDFFNRRLEAGRAFRIPCLGWKEFTPDYVGPFREGTKVCDTENHELPSMLRTCFDRHHSGSLAPNFYQNIKVEKGVIVYA